MNIRIVICFIIICFLPSASFGAADKVWSAKTSGFIKSNESLSYDNYVVKVIDLNDTTATMIVFKDRTQLEKKVFRVNEFKKYEEIGITLLLINGDRSWISVSRLEEKELWIPSGRTTLKWGDTYSIENYSIGIEALGRDSVNLTISINNTVRTDAFTGNSSKDYENMRIVVLNINRTGLIELEFLKFSIPAINMQVVTDKEEYHPDENVNVSINITSNELLNVALINLENIDSKKFQPDYFTATGINGTKTFKSRLKEFPANSTININARIDVRDFRNESYLTYASKVITVTPYIFIEKRVPDETDDENVSVELLVYNSGTNTTRIRIHDNVSEEADTRQMDWNIELEPGKSRNLTYYIYPEKPGIYTLGTATAQWNGQKSTSKKTKMTVHMPYIRIVKTAINNENVTNVELTILNTGDRPSIVSVTDTIPDGYQLENGTTTWSGLVDGGKNTRLVYSLKGNPDYLPEAKAVYRDIRGAIREARSNIVRNDKMPVTGEKESTTTLQAGSNEIIIFMLLSFFTFSGIFGSIAIAIYLITKIKMRSK